MSYNSSIMHMQLDDMNMHHVHKILYVLLVRALRTHHRPCINSSVMHMQLDGHEYAPGA